MLFDDLRGERVGISGAGKFVGATARAFIFHDLAMREAWIVVRDHAGQRELYGHERESRLGESMAATMTKPAAAVHGTSPSWSASPK